MTDTENERKEEKEKRKAEKKAEKMDTDINQLNQQIKDNTAELEETYLSDE